MEKAGREETMTLPTLPFKLGDYLPCGVKAGLSLMQEFRAYGEACAAAATEAERERAAEAVLQELGDTGQAQAIAAAIRGKDPITSYYEDRANGAHAAKAP